jgi:membrane protease YdiL (CAAX protease family)
MAVPGQPVGERAETTAYGASRRSWPGYTAAAVLLLVGTVGAGILGGQLAQFMLAGIQVLPFAVLALFAYAGIRQTWAKVFAFLWLGIVLLGLGGLAVLMMLSALLARTGALGANPDPAKLLAALFSPQIGAILLWTLVGLVVAGVLLIPAVRRIVARALPIDPHSSVHAIALSVVSGAIIISLGQLIAAGGRPPLLETVEATPRAMPQGSDTDQLLLTVYGFAWTVPAALVAGGFPVVRTLRGAFQRLGLVRPTRLQVLGAIGLAVLMAGGASLLDVVIGRLWSAMGWPQTNSAAFERLLGGLVSPIGAVLIGITAGLGEEMVVRGVLQPRLGILLSNLFFASLHAYQYGFDGLLSVFIIGLILGVVRKRTNTTTSSIVHGTYDFVLVMVSALQQQGVF